MNECIVGKIVPVGQADTIPLPIERLYILLWNFRIEVLHNRTPRSIQLLTWPANELVVFGSLRVAEVSRLIFDVFPYGGWK